MSAHVVQFYRRCQCIPGAHPLPGRRFGKSKSAERGGVWWRWSFDDSTTDHTEKRRADVVGIFPNEASISRLIGAVLFGQTDEWQTASHYMVVEAFAIITPRKPTLFSALQPKPPNHALRPPGKSHQLDGRDRFQTRFL